MADKVTFAPISTFTNDSTATTQTNANYVLMQTALDNTVSRDGTTPNQMGASLDMNGNRILNLSAPGSLNEPVRFADLGTIPPGGITYGPPTGLVSTTSTPGASNAVMRADAAPAINLAMAPTWSGVHTFSVAPVISSITNTGTLTLPTTSDTLVGRATTDTLTNKTLTSPTINTPTIATPTITNATLNTATTINTALTVNTDVVTTGFLKSGGFTPGSAVMTVTSNTTLANVPGLTVNLGAGAQYLFEVDLIMSSASNNFQIAMNGTAAISLGALNVSAIWNINSGVLGPTITAFNTFPATVINANPAGTNGSLIRIIGNIVTVASTGAGTLVVQFAQNTSSATASTLISGWMKVFRVT